MLRKSLIASFLILFVLCLFYQPAAMQNGTPANYDKADIAWMLTATGLVLLMTPGLAFFYGGMVEKKNVISTMAQSYVCMVIISVLWMVVGFSLCFGESIGGVIGNPSTFFMMRGMQSPVAWPGAPTIPLLLYAFYQLKFAIITPALITGAFAGRIRFAPYLLFVVLFTLVIYCPLAHLTWHPNGLLARFGVLDFAGGTVVHMSAGWAALCAALFLQKRSDRQLTHSRITYVLLGTGLLWFGWLGFNAGSAFGANALAATALATTTLASAAAAFGWMVCEVFTGRKPGAMGICIGAVVGLVAITPAAGYVKLHHAVVIGLAASVCSYAMVAWRSRTEIDDTLDVFPCHGVGGIVGMVLTGVFASKEVNEAVTVNGLWFGETGLFVNQTLALFGVSIFVVAASFALLFAVNKISPLRASLADEELGLDATQHGERL